MAASSTTQFDGAKAAQWEKEVQELNAQTEQILKNIRTCVAEIQGESAGQIADAFVKTAEGMVQKFDELVRSVGELVTVIFDVAKKFLDLSDTVVSGVKTVAGLFGIHF